MASSCTNERKGPATWQGTRIAPSDVAKVTKAKAGLERRISMWIACCFLCAALPTTPTTDSGRGRGPPWPQHGLTPASRVRSFLNCTRKTLGEVHTQRHGRLSLLRYQQQMPENDYMLNHLTLRGEECRSCHSYHTADLRNSEPRHFR